MSSLLKSLWRVFIQTALRYTQCNGHKQCLPFFLFRLTALAHEKKEEIRIFWKMYVHFENKQSSFGVCNEDCSSTKQVILIDFMTTHLLKYFRNFHH